MLQRPTVRLPGGAAMVAHRRPPPDGEDLMHRDGGGVPSPRKCLTQEATYRDRRGSDDVPILHATKRTRQTDRLRPSVRQGPLGQGFHALFQGHIAPPIAGGPRHGGHLTLQRRAQHIRLVGSPGVPAELTMARTNIPRFSVRSRAITPHCLQSRSISCWGSIASKTSRTSSPVMALPAGPSPHILSCRYLSRGRVTHAVAAASSGPASQVPGALA